MLGWASAELRNHMNWWGSCSTTESATAFELFRDVRTCIAGEVEFLSLEVFPKVTEQLSIVKWHFLPTGILRRINKMSSGHHGVCILVSMGSQESVQQSNFTHSLTEGSRP